MRVVPETIYQALYVQARGGLRREVHDALRSGRTRRKPRKTNAARRPRFRDPMVMIADRSPEIEDRTVPGHWEGDLITGRLNKTTIGTLLERTTWNVMLVHLPVYFCDPASPWQRSSNENTNGLLEWSPKGSDLSVFGLEDLERVARELNDRPRKSLGWDTPAKRFRDLLIST